MSPSSLKRLLPLIGSASLLSCSPPSSAERSFTVRFATLNTSLSRPRAGQLIEDLASGADSQAQAVAEILQRVRPDVVVLNEFDYDPEGRAVDHFQERYLAIPQSMSGELPAEPIRYREVFYRPVNTGVASGLDLNNDGTVGESGGAYGQDAFGFGLFPGQFGMVLLSRFPIDSASARTFQTFLWDRMPGALLPVDPETGTSWYDAEELDRVRLSSKSHWDVPIRVGDRVIHALVSHPTPPVFDGPEDRNGRRNHDEIRFWVDYLSADGGAYLVDDRGAAGGLSGTGSFVLMGDLNSDPFDGDSRKESIRRLLAHERVNISFTPASQGGTAASSSQEGVNLDHEGDPSFDTADFGDSPGSAGNLRVDYVLPSTDLEILDGAVFWPTGADPLSPLLDWSDHRLVWMDLRVGNTAD